MTTDSTQHSVLVIGRSQTVLNATVDLLRDRGYAAQATNNFEAITDQADPRTLELVVFGGQVAPDREGRDARGDLRGESRRQVRPGTVRHPWPDR